MTKVEMFYSNTQRSPDGLLRCVTGRWIQFFRFSNSKKKPKHISHCLFSVTERSSREKNALLSLHRERGRGGKIRWKTKICEIRRPLRNVRCVYGKVRSEKSEQTHKKKKKMHVLHWRWLETCRVYREKQCALCWPGPLKVNYIFLYLEEGEVNTNLRSGYYGKSLTSTFDLLVWSGLNASLSPLSQIFGGRLHCFWRLKRSHALQPGGLSK